jgi:O-Antigen ligase
VATALAVGGLILVPGAVLSRFSLSMETPSGKMEARGRIYKAAIDHLPDYIILGVGAGNFAGPWGRQSQYFDHGFKGIQGGVKGAHNVFIQVTIFWGLPALVMLIVLVYHAYRCLPRGGGKDILVICAYGLAVSLLWRMMFTHGLAEKQYAVGLGFLVGGYLWVWSKRLLPPLGRMQPLRYPVVKHTP